MSPHTGFFGDTLALRVPQGGIYLLTFELWQAMAFRAGALGCVGLGVGRFIYVGSAQRCLAQRVERHFRRRKRLRWHIDYLTHLQSPRKVAVWALAKESECVCALTLLARWGPGVVHFGSSDCNCASHLIGPVGEEWLEVVSEIVGAPAAVVDSHE